MALIKCPKCGNDVSDQAEQCPHCSFKMYSNSVAKSFKVWSERVKKLGIFVLVIMIIGAIIAGASSGAIGIFWGAFIGAFLIYSIFIANSLILLAVAEIIQKLQNIEDNTRNK